MVYGPASLLIDYSSKQNMIYHSIYVQIHLCACTNACGSVQTGVASGLRMHVSETSV